MSTTRLWKHLFAPVDIASLVYFRIAFGGIMLWQIWRYIDSNWIERYYIDPDFHFAYLGFSWVRHWPGDGMYLHFYALGILAIFILTGFMYRLSATLFFFGFTYVFLLEQARYLNHFYLICLVSLLMIFVPAHRNLSIDARLRPRIRSEKMPAWPLWLLRAQLGLVYFFGGIAKLNLDWLTGWPLRMWLPRRSDVPFIGPVLDTGWSPALQLRRPLHRPAGRGASSTGPLQPRCRQRPKFSGRRADSRLSQSSWGSIWRSKS